MPRRRRKKSRFRPITTKSVIIALVAVFMLAVFMPGVNSIHRSGRPSTIVVHQGDGFRSIIDELHDAKTIRFRWPVLAAGTLFPWLHKIKPGRYTIPPNLSSWGILHYLHTRPQDEVRLMIPNGMEQRKIAGIIAARLDIDSTAFMKASRDPRLLESLGIRGRDTEGYLFPGTYNFAWSSKPEEVIRFLAGRFRIFYSDSLRQMAEKQGLDENRLLTIASIVEAETPIDSEKPLIASVYLNRLKKNMRLQADPTVQYAIAGDSRRLTYKDLETDSPYNTYRRTGLPPGPICNPGAASIRAVLDPAVTGYLFFVANGRGGHSFATDFAGHTRNVRRYRVVIAAQAQDSVPNIPR